MRGTAGLHALRVECIVGIYPHERERAQPLLVDVEVDYDFAAAAASDAIPDAVDYDDIGASVTALATERRFHLIETLAEEAAAMLLDRVRRASAVRLTIRKPDAVPSASYAYVRVERTRA